MEYLEISLCPQVVVIRNDCGPHLLGLSCYASENAPSGICGLRSGTFIPV